MQLEIDPYATPENPVKEGFLLSPTQELPIICKSLVHQINTVEMEDYWLDVSPSTESNLPTNDSLSELLDDNISENKSPSPLIYPQRPPKGRKSLASVELPNFDPRLSSLLRLYF